jgi:hypothetical protein
MPSSGKPARSQAPIASAHGFARERRQAHDAPGGPAVDLARLCGGVQPAATSAVRTFSRQSVKARTP